MAPSWILNENSSITTQPNSFNGRLYSHQLAMLAKCITIENQKDAKFSFGFLADKAGTGKTNVIISLILLDKEMVLEYCQETSYPYFSCNKKTIIVVPQNLIEQWKNEIKKFSNDFLIVKVLDYEFIQKTCFSGSIKHDNEYDILLSSPEDYTMFLKEVSYDGPTITRVIYDEIDTMNENFLQFEEKSSLIKKAHQDLEERNRKVPEYQRNDSSLFEKQQEKGINIKMTWFVSASIYNMVNEITGFSFLGNHIPSSELSKLFVKCDSQFIIDNLPEIEDEEEYLYTCKSLGDYYCDVLPIETIDAINSLSFDEVKLLHRRKVPVDCKELLTMQINEYFDQLDKHTDNLVSLQKQLKSWAINSNDNSNGINVRINIENKKINFYNTLIDKFHSVKCDSPGTCKDKKSCILEAFRYFSENIKGSTKEDNIKEILKFCKEKSNPKIIIFSDFIGSFKYLPGIMEQYDLKYENLLKGNSESIAKVIEDFKHSDINVLFLKSSSDACGLNLQETTDLVFLHRTNEILKDQIIGRALRQGRQGVLKIFFLYNENEILETDEFE